MFFDEFYPWAILVKQKCLIQTTLDKEKVFLDDVLLGRTNIEWGDTNEIVNHFFKNTRPNLLRLCKNAHLWILYYVTRGCIRSDKNKFVYYFRGHRSDESDTKWAHKIKYHNDNLHWLKMENGWEILQEIAEKCQEVYECILLRFERLCTNRDYCKNSLTNFRRLPEFVVVQSNRAYNHKNHFWSHLGAKQGGNADRLKPTKCIPHRIQSVHWYLQNYHQFLGKITRKVKI